MCYYSYWYPSQSISTLFNFYLQVLAELEKEEEEESKWEIVADQPPDVDASLTNQGLHNNTVFNDNPSLKDSIITNQMPRLNSMTIQQPSINEMNGFSNNMDLNGNDKSTPSGVEKLALIEHGLADPPEEDTGVALVPVNDAVMVNGGLSDDEDKTSSPNTQDQQPEQFILNPG